MSDPPKTYIPESELDRLLPYFDFRMSINEDDEIDQRMWKDSEDVLQSFYQRWVRFPDPRDVDAAEAFMVREKNLAISYLASRQRRDKTVGVFHAMNFGESCYAHSHNFEEKTLRELSRMIVDVVDQEANIFRSFARKKRVADLHSYGLSEIEEPKGESYYDSVYLPAVCRAPAPPTTLSLDAFRMIAFEFPNILVGREAWNREFDQKMHLFDKSCERGHPSALRLVYALMCFKEDENLPPRVQESMAQLPACYSFERLRAVAQLWRNWMEERYYDLTGAAHNTAND